MSISELVKPGSKCIPGETLVELTGDVTVIAGRGVQVLESRNNNNNNSENNNNVVTKTRLVASVAGIVKKTLSELMTSSSSSQNQNQNGNNDDDDIPADSDEDADHQQQKQNKNRGRQNAENNSLSIIQYEVTTPSNGMTKYFPEVGDFVIGIIVRQVGASHYQVHISSAYLAVLEAIAFDGASKHSKPRLLPGDLVYAHVTRADPDLDIVLSCCSLPHMERKDWVTGEGTFGPLSSNGSAMVRVSLQFAKDLIANQSPVLSLLGRKTSFEAAVGANGIVWISNFSAFMKNNKVKKEKQQQQTSQTGGPVPANSAANEVTVLTKEETRKQVYALVALCQCVVGAENDLTAEATQERVERYFPTQVLM